jgi:hypothetical protein
MRTCLIVCTVLVFSMTGCASWHRPELVYRGRPQVAKNRTARLEKPDVVPAAIPVELEFPLKESNPQASDPQGVDSEGDEETLTPPIEGTPHRSKYRGPRASGRLPINPPGSGYIELPPPPEDE